MNVAVVGDVHGHLALMYAILGRWQRETERHIDLILQAGDLGAFVETSRLDRATRGATSAGMTAWRCDRPPAGCAP